MTNGEAVFIANNAGESVIYLIKDLLLKIFLPIGACIIALVYIAQIDIVCFIIFLLCFAFILLSSFTGFREGEIPLTVILVAVIFLGQQIYEGIVVQDNISNMAHILGGIVGGIIGFSWNKK